MNRRATFEVGSVRLLLHADPVYQSSTAHEDHKNDERLEVVVLNDGEAGPSKNIPDFPSAMGCIYIQTWTSTVTL